MESMPLSGKKILFFSPAFFGYELKIRDKMKELGAEVWYFNERPIEASYQRALLKINPNIFRRKTKTYFSQILSKVEHITFDYVLFIKCEMPAVDTLLQYRQTFPQAKFCLYLWDSLANIKNIEKKLAFFDVINSFDSEDSRKNNKIKFRPLFFSDDFERSGNRVIDYKYDLSFFGTIHSDRYRIIKIIKEMARKKHFNIYLFNFLQGRFMYTFYKLTKPEFKNTTIDDFDFDKMSSAEIAAIVEESKIILDIQHPKQTGLTMRTIEILGMRKKLMTTNTAIRDYDFYHPANISIIDRNNVVIDTEFIKQEYQPLSPSIYQKYSLKQWVLDVL